VLKRTPHSDVEWISLIRSGIPTAAVDGMIKVVRLSRAEFGATL
jgi:hypothetical protein